METVNINFSVEIKISIILVFLLQLEYQECSATPISACLFHGPRDYSRIECCTSDESVVMPHLNLLIAPTHQGRITVI